LRLFATLLIFSLFYLFSSCSGSCDPPTNTGRVKFFIDLVPDDNPICTPNPNNFIGQEFGQNDGRNLFSNDIDDFNNWYVEFIITGECAGQQKKWCKIWCKNILDGGRSISFDRGFGRLAVEIPDLPLQDCEITATVVERCNTKVALCNSSCSKSDKRVVYTKNFMILNPQPFSAFAGGLKENKALSECGWCPYYFFSHI
jgi:hypothetical protein